MLSLVEADEAQRVALAEVMKTVTPGGYDAPWLAEGDVGRNQKVCSVLDHGKPVALFWYWIADNNTLVLCAACSRTSEDIFKNMQRGMELLCRKNGLTAIEICTARHGLAKKLKQAGYVAEAVRFRKTL
jgi:hypothetical protein